MRIGAEREAGGERLGDQHNVGHRGKFLVREIAAGAAEAALNFVGDEERSVFRSKRTRPVPEFFADGINPAFALNGFEEDGADGIVEFGFEIGDIIEADKFDAGNERLEGKTILFRGGDADGAECAAMKRIFERQDTVLAGWRTGIVGGSAARQPGQLESAFDGFSTAIGEENAIEAGPLGKFASQRALKRVVKKIGKMNRARGLAADDLDDAGMRVAQSVDGDAAQKIEILFAARIVNVSAAAVRENNGLALVGRQKKLIGIAQDGSRLGCARRRLLYLSGSDTG